MLSKNKKTEEANFWLSYADLMAGLLFVFILLIGAIVVKSTILKYNLASKENSLESSIEMLLLRDKEVQKLKNLLLTRDNELNSTKKELLISKNSLKLETQEIVNLNNILLSQNMKIDDFNDKIIIMQNLLDESNSTISTQNTKLEDYSNKVIVLSNTLTDKDNSLKLQDEKVLKLLHAIEDKETKYDTLIAKLQEQKAKIKSLTGIKIKVIAELKRSLGKNVAIDTQSGSLRLASNILFEKNCCFKAIFRSRAKKSFY